jgi:hypothetical protein
LVTSSIVGERRACQRYRCIPSPYHQVITFSSSYFHSKLNIGGAGLWKKCPNKKDRMGRQKGSKKAWTGHQKGLSKTFNEGRNGSSLRVLVRNIKKGWNGSLSGERVFGNVQGNVKGRLRRAGMG